MPGCPGSFPPFPLAAVGLHPSSRMGEGDGPSGGKTPGGCWLDPGDLVTAIAAGESLTARARPARAGRAVERSEVDAGVGSGAG